MRSLNCKLERFSNTTIAVALLIIGLLFCVSGFTILPVIGFIVAVPAFIVSFLFFKAERSKECLTEIEKEA